MLAQDGQPGPCGPNAQLRALEETETGNENASTVTPATAVVLATPSKWTCATNKLAPPGPTGTSGCRAQFPVATDTSCTEGIAAKVLKVTSVAKAAELNTENAVTHFHCARCGANGADGRLALHLAAED